MTELVLPWPPKELSPNARVHWSKRAKAAKAYRHACYVLTKQAKLSFPESAKGLHLWIDFYPPNRIRRDDDNLLSAFKAGRDGIADALGIDDRSFVSHPLVKADIGGMVKVRFTLSPEVMNETR